jgi:hypothetical protein
MICPAHYPRRLKTTKKRCTFIPSAHKSSIAKKKAKLDRPVPDIGYVYFNHSFVYSYQQCDLVNNDFNVEEITTRIRQLAPIKPSSMFVAERNTPEMNKDPVFSKVPDQNDRIAMLVALNMPLESHIIGCDLCSETYTDVMLFDIWLDNLFQHNRPYNDDPSRIVSVDYEEETDIYDV